MFFAGHLPKKTFDASHLEGMPVIHPDFDGLLDHGFYRTWDVRGRPVVIYSGSWDDRDDVSFLVRPVVRVKVA
jgi:hypothetical protein